MRSKSAELPPAPCQQKTVEPAGGPHDRAKMLPSQSSMVIQTRADFG